MNCHRCGNENSETALYCSSCGNALASGRQGVGENGSHNDGAQPGGERLNVEPLERMSVLSTVFLTFITAGIYPAVWFIKRIDIINSFHSEVKLTSGVFGFIVAGLIVNVGILFYMVAGGPDMAPALVENLNLTSNVLGMAVQVAILIQSLKVRTVLTDHFVGHLKKDVSISWLATFFFTIYYLQHKINGFSDERVTA